MQRTRLPRTLLPVATCLASGPDKPDWLGVHPSGQSFAVRFVDVVLVRDGLMARESIYFDLATLCEQAGVSYDGVHA